MIYVIIFFVSLVSLVAFLTLKSYHLRSNTPIETIKEHWYHFNLKQWYDRMRTGAHPFMKKGVYWFLNFYQRSVHRLRGLMRTFVQKLLKKYGDSDIIPASQSDFLEKIREHKNQIEKE
jgi:hypothetical protein